jgi:tRNA pseudouridine55 synthase
MLGALIIDKPEGITSHDVVAHVRHIARTRRVGHAGTLDPFATGVLVVCTGRATRLVQFLVGLDKEYIAKVRLGYATDTQDRTGKQITPLRTSNELSLEDLKQVLDEFTGPQLQIPPMFSAKKVDGERLYRAARAGREVEREPVSVTIHSIEVINDVESALNITEDGTAEFSMSVRCGSGTYIRTLAHDVGERLGLGGHLVELRRTAVGHFRIDDALNLSDVEAMSRDELSHKLITPSAMLAHLRALNLEDERVAMISNGRSISLQEYEAASIRDCDAPIRLCDAAGWLAAVGDYDSRLKLVKPRVVLGGEGV